MSIPASFVAEILMPTLSVAADNGRLVKWLVAEGDEVRAGDVIAEIETDAATMEIEAVADGRVARILVAAGTDGVKVDTPIALIAAAVASNADEVAPQAAHATQIVQSQHLPPTEVSQSKETALRCADLPDTPLAALATQTMRDALRDAVAEEMRRDGEVFVLGEDVGVAGGAHKVCAGLIDEFGPRRVIDTPVAGQGLAGIGIGSALAGLKPVVEVPSWNFALQAIDQIVNSAAKTLYMSGGEIAVPIVFRGANGLSSRAAAQHAQCLSAWFAHVPGLKVVAPSNPADAKGLLKAAIRDPGPVLVMESEALYGTTGPVGNGDDALVSIGRARIAREGRHVSVVAYARGVVHALAAADRLAGEGIDAEIVDLRTLRPLDIATVLQSVRKTHRLVTVEEAWPVCSVGSEICARVAIEAFDALAAPPVKIAGADVPMPYAANLEKLALPDADSVAAAVREVCHGAL